ncbi:MAG TPA: hypothetical protein VJG83_00665 [archaeon]|nr:hypothetical protein [archaeon]
MEDVPRRMRRFYRKPTEGEVKDRSAQIAIEHVDDFKKEQGRYPSSREIDNIAQNVFEQLKADLKKGEEISEDIDLGKLKDDGTGKSLLDARKERRAKEAKQSQKRGKKTQEEAEDQTEEEQTDEQEQPAQKKATPQADIMEKVGVLEQIENEQNVKKLAELDELSNLEGELDSEDDSDLVEKEMDGEIDECPRCKSKTADFIYCPNCGDAFCNHCAKSVEPQPDTIKYTCPNCAEEFKKNKPLR